MIVTLAFDIERSGPTNKEDTIAIGAAVIDENFKELDSLFLPGYFPQDTKFEANCWVFWKKFLDILQTLTYNGELSKIDCQKEMITEFMTFRSKWEKWCDDNGHELLVVSDNNVYDGGFLNQMIFDHLPKSLPIPFTVNKKKFGKFYETSSMKHILKKSLNCKSNADFYAHLGKIFTPPAKKYDHDHNPAHDAYGIAYDYIWMVKCFDHY